MIKFIIEGASAAGMREAMDDALRQAAEHLTESSDILISLLERRTRRGGGCDVRLEVTTLPSGSQGRERALRQPVARQAATDALLVQKRADAATAWKKCIVDHFRKRMGVEAGISTRLHLENLQEFAIMGEIEREFFNISHAVKPFMPESSVAEPAHVTLNTEKPE